MKNMIDVTNDKTSFDYKIYKKLFWVPAIINGKEIFIKKMQFFTGLNSIGRCEVKIDGRWYMTTRNQVLNGLRKYNRQKRLSTTN